MVGVIQETYDPPTFFARTRADRPFGCGQGRGVYRQG